MHDLLRGLWTVQGVRDVLQLSACNLQTFCHCFNSLCEEVKHVCAVSVDIIVQGNEDLLCLCYHSVTFHNKVTSQCRLQHTPSLQDAQETGQS